MSQSINDPNFASAVQAPRILVMALGSVVPGCVSASADRNNWYSSDRWEATFALGVDAVHTAQWWDDHASDQPSLVLDISFALDGISFVPMLTGVLDQVNIDPIAQIVHVEGRDLSSVFQEARTAETFQNQTSSEVAQTLAARHQMTADVDPTTTLVGKFYQIDHVHMSAGQYSRTTTEWDLLTYLAQHEGYDLYVSGTTLHFKQPAPADAPPFVVRFLPPLSGAASPVCNVQNPRLMRAATLAKDIEVVVNSWNARTGAAITAKAKAIGAKSASPAVAANQVGTTTQRYTYLFPNLSHAAAQAKANAILADLSKHERRISFDVLNDLALTPRNLIQVQGSGTGFDQSYFVDTVHRHVGFREGFTMHVEAKNHDTRSQIAPDPVPDDQPLQESVPPYVPPPMPPTNWESAFQTYELSKAIP